MAFGVSDFHDLVSLLEQHPEWRGDLRRLLLSDEILTLPELVRELAEGQKRTDEAVRELVESQKRTDEQIRQLTARVDDLTQRLEQLTARVDDIARRLEQLTARVDDLTQRLEQLTARVDDLTQRLEQLTARVDDLTQRLEQLTARVDDLTQRLEQLTARVDDLTQRLEQLTARVEQMAARLDQLGQRVDELTAAVASLTRSMERVSQDVAKMKGYYLEQRYYQRAPAYFSKIVRRVRAVSYEDLCRLLDDAMDSGVLTETERDDLIETDVVVHGRKREDGAEVYLIVEVSWGIGPSDVSRASQRARTFSKLGWQTLPVVAGEWADDDAKEAARRNGVVILLDGGLAFGAV